MLLDSGFFDFMKTEILVIELPDDVSRMLLIRGRGRKE